MIATCGLLSTGFSEVVVPDTTAVKIPLEAKHLSTRYAILKNKKIAWNKRKKALIKKFKELYESDDFLGDENRYGKLRRERHKKHFYASLKERDDEIETKLIMIKKKLRKAQLKYPRLSLR
jgi:ABC-type multidrug transport system ATPase subunit